eukprot:gene11017-18981_t
MPLRIQKPAEGAADPLQDNWALQLLSHIVPCWKLDLEDKGQPGGCNQEDPQGDKHHCALAIVTGKQQELTHQNPCHDDNHIALTGKQHKRARKNPFRDGAHFALCSKQHEQAPQYPCNHAAKRPAERLKHCNDHAGPCGHGQATEARRAMPAGGSYSTPLKTPTPAARGFTAARPLTPGVRASEGLRCPPHPAPFKPLNCPNTAGGLCQHGKAAPGGCDTSGLLTMPLNGAVYPCKRVANTSADAVGGGDASSIRPLTARPYCMEDPCKDNANTSAAGVEGGGATLSPLASRPKGMVDLCQPGTKTSAVYAGGGGAALSLLSSRPKGMGDTCQPGTKTSEVGAGGGGAALSLLSSCSRGMGDTCQPGTKTSAVGAGGGDASSVRPLNTHPYRLVVPCKPGANTSAAGVEVGVSNLSLTLTPPTTPTPAERGVTPARLQAQGIRASEALRHPPHPAPSKPGIRAAEALRHPPHPVPSRLDIIAWEGLSSPPNPAPSRPDIRAWEGVSSPPHPVPSKPLTRPYTALHPWQHGNSAAGGCFTIPLKAPPSLATPPKTPRPAARPQDPPKNPTAPKIPIAQDPPNTPTPPARPQDPSKNPTAPNNPTHPKTPRPQDLPNTSKPAARPQDPSKPSTAPNTPTPAARPQEPPKIPTPAARPQDPPKIPTPAARHAETDLLFTLLKNSPPVAGHAPAARPLTSPYTLDPRKHGHVVAGVGGGATHRHLQPFKTPAPAAGGPLAVRPLTPGFGTCEVLRCPPHPCGRIQGGLAVYNEKKRHEEVRRNFGQVPNRAKGQHEGFVATSTPSMHKSTTSMAISSGGSSTIMKPSLKPSPMTWKAEMVAEVQMKYEALRNQMEAREGGWVDAAVMVKLNHAKEEGAKQVYAPPTPGPAERARVHDFSSMSSDASNTRDQSWGSQFCLDDFSVNRVIGSGSYGRVSIAKHISTGRVYAIKCMSKAACLKEGQVKHVIDERNMLLKCNHPFLVSLHGTFQDEKCLYLVMQFVAGGELYTLLRDRGRMREEHARFYAAQIILVLEYLHNKGIVHRDLKPENVLLGADGYIRLTDFGFAKVLRGKTYTFCGTPDYMAPEVDPVKRLGTTSIQEIKDHPWFGGLDWDLLQKKMYRPPVLPEIGSPEDTSSFDDYSNLGPMKHPFTLTQRHQMEFSCF